MELQALRALQALAEWVERLTSSDERLSALAIVQSGLEKIEPQDLARIIGSVTLLHPRSYRKDS